MIDAIVLAAGQSMRMGKPKALLRFQGDTFLEHIISVLKDSIVERIAVVLGAAAEEIEQSVDLSGVEVVINKNYEDGQLSSLIAGINSTPQECEAILVCLVDMPLITVEVVNAVVGRFKETHRPIVVPVFDGKRGHPVLFSRSLFGELRKAPQDKGARYVLYSNKDEILEVPAQDEGILTSIDTPQDYRSHFNANP